MKTKNNRKPNAGDTWAAPEVKRSPTRFRNPIGKYKIMRGPECTACGKHGVVLVKQKQTGPECILLWNECLLCGDHYQDVFD